MLELFRSQGDGARFRSFGVSRLFRLALAEITDGVHGGELPHRKRNRYAEAGCGI